MKEQCHKTVLAIKFKTALLMESSGKGTSLNVKPRTVVKCGCSVTQMEDTSTALTEERCGEEGKTNLILTYPSNPSSKGKHSKFKD